MKDAKSCLDLSLLDGTWLSLRQRGIFCFGEKLLGTHMNVDIDTYAVLTLKTGIFVTQTYHQTLWNRGYCAISEVLLEQ